MAITIDGGTNTISGLAVGGLPDGVVDGDMLASGTGGKILAVVQSTKTDTNSTTSTSATATGLAVTTGTLTSGSKVLVQVSINIGTSATDQRCHVTLWNGATQLFMGDSGTGHRSSGWCQARSTSAIYNVSFMYLHDVGSTSAQTYTVKFHSAGAITSWVNRPHSEDANTGRTASSVTAMEIGA
jgi:hypothetical protein